MRRLTDGAGGEIAEDDLIETPEGLYLSRKLIERLLGLELEYDRRAVALLVSAKDPLPIEVLEHQEQMREGLHQNQDEPIGPLAHEVPYALLSPPFGDVDLFATRNSDGSLGLNYDVLMSAEESRHDALTLHAHHWPCVPDGVAVPGSDGFRRTLVWRGAGKFSAPSAATPLAGDVDLETLARTTTASSAPTFPHFAERRRWIRCAASPSASRSAGGQ